VRREPEPRIEGARRLAVILGKEIGPGIERRRQEVLAFARALGVKEGRLSSREELARAARARDRQVVQPLQRLLRIVGVELVQIGLEQDVVARPAELLRRERASRQALVHGARIYSRDADGTRGGARRQQESERKHGGRDHGPYFTLVSARWRGGLDCSGAMRRHGTLGLAAALLALLTGTAPAQQAGAGQRITWTAGALGGGWFDISSGLAALLREKANLTIGVIPGGGAQNPVLVDKGDAAIGLGLPPLLEAAVRADEPYQRRKMDSLRALAGTL